jgi:hypothetical protein
VAAAIVVVLAELLPIRALAVALFQENRHLTLAVLIGCSAVTATLVLSGRRCAQALAALLPVALIAWAVLNVQQFSSLNAASAWNLSRRADNSLVELIATTRDTVFNRGLCLVLSEQFRGCRVRVSREVLEELHVSIEQLRIWGRVSAVEVRPDHFRLPDDAMASLAERPFVQVQGLDRRPYRIVLDGYDRDQTLEMIIRDGEVWLVPHQAMTELESR